jgi:MerR family transcriptional regulator/heat shock protein HspR
MDRPPDHAVYVISVAAELAGVHPQTLRFYERRGLVQPARTEGGRRRYSDRDIEMLRRIQSMTDEGLNLVGVKRVLELEARLADYEQKIVAIQAASDEAVEQAHRQYRRDLVPITQAVALYKKRRR